MVSQFRGRAVERLSGEGDVIPNAPKAGRDLTSDGRVPDANGTASAACHCDGTCRRSCRCMRIVRSLTGPLAPFGMTSSFARPDSREPALSDVAGAAFHMSIFQTEN